MTDPAPVVSDFREVQNPSGEHIEGLVSASEERFLYWLAATQLRGSGAAVEVGSWYGRSTFQLGAGLQASGRETTLHCFDDFGLLGGDPARHARFLANVRRFGKRVIAHRTLIQDICWRAGPIELLFLDAPKDTSSMLRTLRTFGPHLRPGESFLAVQDYLYFPAYQAAVALHRFRAQLQMTHIVQDGSTVAFRVNAPIVVPGEDVMPTAYRPLPPETIGRIWEELLGPLPARARERIALGQALHLHDAGHPERSRAFLARRELTRFQCDKIVSKWRLLTPTRPKLRRVLLEGVRRSCPDLARAIPRRSLGSRLARALRRYVWRRGAG